MTPTECQDYLFRTGWKVLADMYGLPEAKARSYVGKLVKHGGPQLAVRALEGIQAKIPVDPLPWALAGIRTIQARQAEKNKPGFRPPANLPPVVPIEERVKPERFAELREFLESQS